jgi:hypothetical protein
MNLEEKEAEKAKKHKQKEIFDAHEKAKRDLKSCVDYTTQFVDMDAEAHAR